MVYKKYLVFYPCFISTVNNYTYFYEMYDGETGLNYLHSLSNGINGLMVNGDSHYSLHTEIVIGWQKWLKNLDWSKRYGKWGDRRSDENSGNGGCPHFHFPHFHFSISSFPPFPLVAELDGKVISFGGLIWYIVPSKGLIAWVEELVVDNQYRHQGIGKALMEHLLKIAKYQKIKQVKLTSTLTAKSLYEALGFIKKDNEYLIKNSS